MKNQLSALKFVLNNRKQVWVMMIALSLTFMAMYITNFILQTTRESFKPVFLEQPKKVAFVDLSPETMGVDEKDYQTREEYSDALAKRREEIVQKLKNVEGISEVKYTQTLMARYTGVIGMIGYDFPLLEAKDIEGYVQHMGAKLIEGRYPKESGEILVDEKVLKNNDLKIGDYFLESNYGKVFTVVGVLKSNSMVCVGTPMGYTNTGWYMIINCDEKHSNMTKVLEEIDINVTEYDTVYDIVDWKKKYDEMVCEPIDSACSIILLVVMIFLTISIITAYISFMRSRVSEYCLYSSIGYTRKNIYSMMMREVGIIFGTGILLGSLITIVVMVLMIKLLLENMGIVYVCFSLEHIIRIIGAFLAIVGCLQIPMLITIGNIKTIDMIEE